MWRFFIRHKVVISCGQAFSCVSPGWFRIVFSDQQHKLKLGIQRIKKALDELRGSTSREMTGHRQNDTNGSVRREELKNIKHESKDTSVESVSTQSQQPIVRGCVKTEPVSLADKDFVFLNGQSSIGSESLGSLIGTLRQQIHASDWLEKNKPELAAGDDPTQLDVFIDLLNKAKK